MACPMWVDFTRECITKIKYTPQNTFYYCCGEDYKDCPLYRVINNIGTLCENIDKCPVYEHFVLRDFKKFVMVTDAYCLSDNKVNCKRYQMKKSGQAAPPNMLPDGSLMEQEEK